MYIGGIPVKNDLWAALQACEAVDAAFWREALSDMGANMDALMLAGVPVLETPAMPDGVVVLASDADNIVVVKLK